MDNTYTDAVFGADPDKLGYREKLLLLGLIYRMDNGNKIAMASQAGLGKLCGYPHPNPARDGLKVLQDAGLIIHVGWDKANPSADRETKLYRVELSEIQKLVRKGFKPMVSESATIPPPMVAKSAMVAQTGDELYSGIPPAVEGVAVPVSPKDVEHAPVQYSTVPQSETSTDKNHREKPNPRGAAPNPAEGTTRPRTPRQKDSDTLPPVPPPPTPVFTEKEVADLYDLWLVLGGEPEPITGPEALRRYKGMSAPRLAVTMMFGFTISDYWCRTDKEVWKFGRTVANFLGASKKMDDQFGGWRNNVRDGFLKKFTTVESVQRHVAPQVVDEDESAVSKAFEDEDEVKVPPTPVAKPESPPKSKIPAAPRITDAQRYKASFDKVVLEFAAARKAGDAIAEEVARDDWKGYMVDMKETATMGDKGIWKFTDGSSLQIVPLPKPLPKAHKTHKLALLGESNPELRCEWCFLAATVPSIKDKCCPEEGYKEQARQWAASQGASA